MDAPISESKSVIGLPGRPAISGRGTARHSFQAPLTRNGLLQPGNRSRRLRAGRPREPHRRFPAGRHVPHQLSDRSPGDRPAERRTGGDALDVVLATEFGEQECLPAVPRSRGRRSIRPSACRVRLHPGGRRPRPVARAACRSAGRGWPSRTPRLPGRPGRRGRFRRGAYRRQQPVALQHDQLVQLPLEPDAMADTWKRLRESAGRRCGGYAGRWLPQARVNRSTPQRRVRRARSHPPRRRPTPRRPTRRPHRSADPKVRGDPTVVGFDWHAVCVAGRRPQWPYVAGRRPGPSSSPRARAPAGINAPAGAPAATC